MAEFSGIPPVGINSIVRPAPAVPPPAVPSVEAGLKGGGLSGRMSSDTRHPAADRLSARQARDRADPAQLAGPSPAFQASVLELELDLQNTIARVEAARGKRESDIAGGVSANPDDAHGHTKGADQEFEIDEANLSGATARGDESVTAAMAEADEA